ncbi:hypothetical protein [Absidia glauca]|uniref:PX domain-containing protein n=1 Tax=Absidia glauca TaxID=4829 RepID=A0A163MHT4_ABSGL|nr:hypothetical protein [Absidia glauca]
MSEVIQSIFVRDCETRQQPKPHTVYKVDIHAAVRNWTIWKRYSEFKKLHEQLVALYPDHPPTSPFPSKSLFPPTFGDAQKTEDRRRGLEDYVRAILRDRDDRWRQTDFWRDFLAIPTRDTSTLTMYTSESWLEEYQDMAQAGREIRSLMNKRDTHNARNEISASHHCTVQAKKLLLTMASRLAHLDSGVQTGLSDGELRRRRDMLNTLKEEKDALAKLISTGRQDHDLLYTTSTTTGSKVAAAPMASSPQGTNWMDRKQLLGGESVQRHSTGSRAFGAAASSKLAKETEVTRGLDNEGIAQYQHQLMTEQDLQVEQFSAILNRQKQLGYAIGDELETQTQVLDELDRDVGRTQAKLKFANKRLGKIN